MPTSDHRHLSTVLHFAIALRPKKVLDIGIGNGTYGYMIRQYLDIGEERIKPKEWELQIDGMDIYEGYRNPIWEYFYNSVTIGDMRQLIDKVKDNTYDLLLFNDVLEHVTLDDAHTLLDKALKKAKVVITTTPNREYPQGAWGGNEAETHLCLLAPKDFPHLVVNLPNGDTTAYICSQDADMITAIKDAALSAPQAKVNKLYRPIDRVARKLKKRS